MGSYKVPMNGFILRIELLEPNAFDNVCSQIGIDQPPYGFFLPETNQIFIRMSGTPQHIRRVFWHEFCEFLVFPLHGSKTYNDTNSIDKESCCNLVGDGLQGLMEVLNKIPEFMLPFNNKKEILYGTKITNKTKRKNNKRNPSNKKRIRQDEPE